jgi:hypothetical protein
VKIIYPYIPGRDQTEYHMPVQIVRPRSIGVASGGARRAVLLTGASDVLARAALGRLRDFDVVCLVHRSPVCGPNMTAVPGVRNSVRHWATQRGYGLAQTGTEKAA